MFDRYEIRPQNNVHTTKTVHEHRAPTDQSIRLLREMEEKARDSILDVIYVKNNLIEYTMAIGENHPWLDPVLCIKFKINGNEYKREFRFRCLDDEGVNKLFKEMQSWLMSLILDDPLNNLLMEIRMRREKFLHDYRVKNS